MRRTGQIASKLYKRDDGAMHMRQGELANGEQAVQARAGNGRWTESYPIGRPGASTSLTISG